MSIHPAPQEFNADQLTADPILRYFHYSHLPFGPLQQTSAAFCALANQVVTTIPRNAERTVALRKLLEAKDAAVRANIPMTIKQVDELTNLDDTREKDEGAAIVPAMTEDPDLVLGKSATVDGIEGLPERIKIDEDPKAFGTMGAAEGFDTDGLEKPD